MISDLGLLVTAGISTGVREDKLLKKSIKWVLGHEKEAVDLGHVILYLLGQFKGKIGLLYQSIPVAAVTHYGINNKF